MHLPQKYITEGQALDQLAWRPYAKNGRTDVDIVALYDTTDKKPNGSKAAILRYKAGAKVPTHLHPGYEIIYMISGELFDSNGSYIAGDCLVFNPNSSHSLWTEKGCHFLVVWEEPVKRQAVEENTHV